MGVVMMGSVVGVVIRVGVFFTDLRLDVSMKNLPIMDVFECQTDLHKPVQDLQKR